MAAGDVTGFWWSKMGHGKVGGPPFHPDDVGFVFGGQVQLDGSGATPVDVAALSGHIRTVLGATVSLEGSEAPGLDPTHVTAAASGGVLNIYAWKPTGAGDATLIASTNNARLVNFFGQGAKR